MKDLIESCCEFDPNQRPSFEQICQILNEYVEQEGDKLTSESKKVAQNNNNSNPNNEEYKSTPMVDNSNTTSQLTTTNGEYNSFL